MSSSALALELAFDDEAPVRRAENTTTNLAPSSKISPFGPWMNHVYGLWPSEKAFGEPLCLEATHRLYGLLPDYKIWLDNSPAASFDLGQQPWIQYCSSPDPVTAIGLTIHGARPSFESTRAAELGKKLRATLARLLEDEPLEDGISHPAEEVLIDELRRNAKTLSVVAALAQDEGFKQRADLVLCLGRVPFQLVGRQGLSLVSEILRSSEVVLRDAAARAIELWEDPAGLDLLRIHEDPSPWLAEYIKRLVAATR